MLGQDSFQDIDIAGVTLPIVKHSYVVKDIRYLQQTLCEAFMLAGTGRKGPVHVDIPRCVQQAEYDFDPGLVLSASGAKVRTIYINKTTYSQTLAQTQVLERALAQGLAHAQALINRSARPYIYCGGGVAASFTGEEVVKLSKKLGAPVGMSLMGIGSIPQSYELNLGMSGMHGRYASIMAMAEADLIIALGVRFSDRATGNASEYACSTAVIHIDIDPAEIGKNIRPDVSICGDLRDVLPALLDMVNTKSNDLWTDRINTLMIEGAVPLSETFTPRNIIAAINDLYGDDTVIATDVGQHQMWVAQNYRFEKPRRLVSSGGLGAMGFGLGAAIGASLARGGARTVLFTGDGSFGMNMNEMATAVALGLPITIVLFRNNALGMVRQIQTLFLDNRHSQSTLERKTDYPALAKAFGAAGFTASSLSELDGILKEIPDNKPCLIECKIDIDEKVFPMIPVGGTVKDVILQENSL